MARARGRAARPARAARRDARGGAGPTPSCCAAARAAPALCAARGAGPGDARRDRAAGRPRLRAGAARLPAARRGRRAGRPAPRAGRARARSPTARAVRVQEPLARTAREAVRRSARRHDLDATAADRPHLRHDRRAEAGRADLRQLPLERARLGRRARPRRRASAGSARCRSSHVGGLSILLRSAIYATTAVVHERFETDRALRRAARAGGSRSSASSPRRSRGCSTPACERPPALRCALTGGGPVPPALLERARAAGVPVSLTYGLTETCSQVTTHAARRRSPPRARRRAAAVLHARARSPPTARSSSRGPTVARRRRPPTAGCTPATSARSTSAAPARDRAQGRHDRQRRRERRAGGGRGGARGASRTCSRRRCVGRPRRALGRGCHGDRRRARRARAGRRRAARALRRSARAVQGAQASSCRAGEPLPRTRSGKLLRRELAMSFDADAYRRASRSGWEDGGSAGWVRRREPLRAVRPSRSRTG